MSYTKATLTGTFTRMDGRPSVGTVTISTTPTAIINRGGEWPRPVIVSPSRHELDEWGRFSADLPATDDPNLDPSNFTYAVTVTARDGHWERSGIALPAAAGTVDVSGL